MDNVWAYRDASWMTDAGIVGYDVEATDGSIGKVDEASEDVGASRVVVDTGFWIFGKKRLIPAGAVTGIDHDDRRVTVNMSKDEIKSAPDYDEADWDDSAQARHAEYYGPYSSW
jgi:hypothetical protein